MQGVTVSKAEVNFWAKVAASVVLADEDEVDRHADADGGEDETEDDGVAGDAAGLPGAGAEFVNQLDVAEDGTEGDDDAESDEDYSRPERRARGVGGMLGLGGAELAEEETEAADGESYAHEAETGANPGQEGSLGGEVDAGVLLGGLFG